MLTGRFLNGRCWCPVGVAGATLLHDELTSVLGLLGTGIHAAVLLVLSCCLEALDTYVPSLLKIFLCVRLAVWLA